MSVPTTTPTNGEKEGYNTEKLYIFKLNDYYIQDG